MSQRAVELTLGKLLTDDEFRWQFFNSPAVAFEHLTLTGQTLTSVERDALSALNPKSFGRFAQQLDARLRKVSVHKGEGPKP
jgi:hypothetical protein